MVISHSGTEKRATVFQMQQWWILDNYYKIDPDLEIIIYYVYSQGKFRQISCQQPREYERSKLLAYELGVERVKIFSVFLYILYVFN